MTSSTNPPRQSLSGRVSRALSSGSSHRSGDPEARFTRNVTIGFIVLIAAVALVVIIGLGYGYWEANFKPLANVAGTEVSRNEWQDRQRLEAFRADRAETAIRAMLLSGDIDEDLADRWLNDSANARAGGAAGAMEALVDLLYQGQLAEGQGISLSEDELAAAIAADGTFPEMRRVAALVIGPAGAATGQSSPEARADARRKAEAARAELVEGAPIADLVDEYSPATAANDGDLGYRSLEDAQAIDAAWAEALFALDEGGITDIVETETGDLLIGVATTIVPEMPDTGFLSAVSGEVGEAIHRRNVEREAIAAKLEAEVTDGALSAAYEQMKLAEILVAGDTLVAPEDDEGSVRASHILYQPVSADPESTEAIAEDDPAWGVAEADADRAAADLRAIEDVEARMEAFAGRAAEEGTDATAQTGGDLGFFERGDMVPEFADPIFDAEAPRRGDIIGPVRSQFGWHVIMYNEARGPIAERLAAVEAALAVEGSDFATVATELSDGPEADLGGQTGWHVVEDLDEVAALALSAIDIGEHSEPIDGADGYTIYQKQDEAARPLEPAAAALKARSAFSDWYQEQRFDAEDAGDITIDDSVYGETQGVASGL